MTRSGVPAEIQIIPFGRHETEKGPFVMDEEAAESVIRDFNSRKNDMVIDYEHSTMNACGEAPAAGWIKKLKFIPPEKTEEARRGITPHSPLNLRGDEGGLRKVPGIWAVVDWTPRAVEYLKNREYRYLSPVFLKNLKDNRVLRLVNAALTNQPAIDGMVPVVNRARPGASLPAHPFNSEGASPPQPLHDGCLRGDAPQQGPGTESPNKITLPPLEKGGKGGFEKEEKMQRLMEALGLPADATEDRAVEAAAAMKSGTKEVCDLLGREPDAALSEAVGTITAMKDKADQAGDVAALYEREHAAVVALEAEVSALRQAAARRDAAGLVEQAMKEGKVAPAQRDWATGYAERDPEGFRVFMAKAPVVVPMGEVGTAHSERTSGVLDETQTAVNRALGLSAESWRKFGARRTEP
jgi:phage I-like protein